MKPTIRKRTLPHPWLQNQWNARWTLRTCQTSLQCAWLISCIMLHGYMFMIQPRGLDTCACGDIGRSRYTTHVVLNLILLISRDAIHMVVCRYTHRSVVLLQADDWNQLGLRGEHRCSKDDSPRYLPSGYKYATSSCTSFGNNVVFIWERGT